MSKKAIKRYLGKEKGEHMHKMPGGHMMKDSEMKKNRKAMKRKITEK